jgi:hypothetical protein
MSQHTELRPYQLPRVKNELTHVTAPWAVLRGGAFEMANAAYVTKIKGGRIDPDSPRGRTDLIALWISAYVAYIVEHGAATGYDLLAGSDAHRARVEYVVTVDAYMAYGASNAYDVNFNPHNTHAVSILAADVFPFISAEVSGAVKSKLEFILALMSAAGAGLDDYTVIYALSYITPHQAAQLLFAITQAMNRQDAHSNADAAKGRTDDGVKVAFLLGFVKGILDGNIVNGDHDDAEAIGDDSMIARVAQHVARASEARADALGGAAREQL